MSGPCKYPNQAAVHVPTIIIPSRPMLITPALSAHNPPKPAMRSGIAKRRVAPDVPGDEISVAPVKLSTSEMIKNIAATTKVIRAGDLKNVFTLPVLFAALFASIAITWTPYQEQVRY